MATITVGDGKTYSTIVAAEAAANAGDTIEVYKPSLGVYGYRSYWDKLTVSKGVDIIAMDIGIQIGDVRNNLPFTLTSGTARLVGFVLNVQRINCDNTSGATIIIDKCFFRHETGARTFSAAISGDIFITNSIVITTDDESYLFHIYDASLTLYNNTIVRAGYGGLNLFYGYNFNSSLVACNNIFINYCGTQDIIKDVITVTEDYNLYYGGGTINDGGADGANDIGTTAIEDTGLSMWQGSNGIQFDYRTISSRENAGTKSFNSIDLIAWDNGRLTTDIDGRTRSLYSIGATEGYNLAGDPDTVIKSAGGNYNDDNLIDSNVKKDILYGIGGIGTYDPTGTPPDAPQITNISVNDGSIIITYLAANETDIIYARYRRNQPAYGWEDRSETFKRTGSGAITITGVINGIEYELSGQSLVDVCYSDFAGSRFAAPDSDAFAVSRYNNKLNIRNTIARAQLHIAQQNGVKISFTNTGEDEITGLYAIVDQPSTQIVDIQSNQIDRSDIILNIPRQTNFPPTDFKPNCIVKLNDQPYRVLTVAYDLEDINMTAVFTLTCSINGDQCGY